MFVVNVNQTDFFVELLYKRYNKKIYLRVKNGVIHITTPTKLSMYTIQDMICRNFNSIIKLMNDSKKIEDKLHFLGNEYQIQFKESSLNLAYILEDKFIIECKDLSCAPKLVESFYKDALQKVVETYAKEIFYKFDITFPIDFEYKNVKGYFGECFPTRKKIILATKLAKYDLKFILSVIYHECAHFKYLDHQEAFYKYLEARYPNYRRVQKELRSIKYHDKY
ncbi:MAG: M48 family metallopeptidase [Anaeroplasmataceae bacterium]|nr:M48 family metallopeptidase [Anaeroplasmataceae bacterium]